MARHEVTPTFGLLARRSCERIGGLRAHCCNYLSCCNDSTVEHELPLASRESCTTGITRVMGGLICAAAMQELPFVQHLEPRMAASKEKLQFRLSAALKAALVDKHASARQHCLLAYASISDAAGAEQVPVTHVIVISCPFPESSTNSCEGTPQSVSAT